MVLCAHATVRMIIAVVLVSSPQRQCPQRILRKSKVQDRAVSGRFENSWIRRNAIRWMYRSICDEVVRLEWNQRPYLKVALRISSSGIRTSKVQVSHLKSAPSQHLSRQ